MEIEKITGESEKFEEKKLYDSIKSAGVNHSLAQEVIRMVTHDANNMRTTNRLHYATQQALLKHHDMAAVARYNLKGAVAKLGPTGYPFEEYIARLFQRYGYNTKTNQIIQGKCVTHEVDVLATRKEGNITKHYMLECKHHHFLGAKTNIQVALYTYARFQDVLNAWCADTQCEPGQHTPWIVTNTRVTKQAIEYAECVGMRLLAWQYPKRASLNSLIEAQRLYPITVIPNLSKKTIAQLLKHKYVLLEDLQGKTIQQISRATRLSHPVVRKVVAMAKEVLKNPHPKYADGKHAKLGMNQ